MFDPRINVVKGNVLHAPCGYIIHGCNTSGRMGKGVALEIRKKWPKIYVSYLQAFNLGRLQLGSISGGLVAPQLCVINAVTQIGYGNDGHPRTHPPSIGAAFGAVVQMASVTPQLENVPMVISFPLIGCGLGGGDWKLVEPEILAAVPIGWKLNLYLKD